LGSFIPGTTFILWSWYKSEQECGQIFIELKVFQFYPGFVMSISFNLTALEGQLNRVKTAPG